VPYAEHRPAILKHGLPLFSLAAEVFDAGVDDVATVVVDVVVFVGAVIFVFVVADGAVVAFSRSPFSLSLSADGFLNLKTNMEHEFKRCSTRVSSGHTRKY